MLRQISFPFYPHPRRLAPPKNKFLSVIIWCPFLRKLDGGYILPIFRRAVELLYIRHSSGRVGPSKTWTKGTIRDPLSRDCRRGLGWKRSNRKAGCFGIRTRASMCLIWSGVIGDLSKPASLSHENPCLDFSLRSGTTTAWSKASCLLRNFPILFWRRRFQGRGRTCLCSTDIWSRNIASLGEIQSSSALRGIGDSRFLHGSESACPLRTTALLRVRKPFQRSGFPPCDGCIERISFASATEFIRRCYGTPAESVWYPPSQHLARLPVHDYKQIVRPGCRPSIRGRHRWRKLHSVKCGGYSNSFRI